MARRGRACVVNGCHRTAAVGSVVCAEHRETALGEQTDREIIKLTQRLDAMSKYETEEEKRAANREFRRQVVRGEYAALFSTEMVAALYDEGQGYGMQKEIGMMRVAMMRLLLEEENPSRMAHALAKLSGSLGKAMERQQGWEREARKGGSYAAYEAGQRELADKAAKLRAAREAAEAQETVIEAPGRVVEDGEGPVIDGSAWPRPGYPDYYTDVDEVEKRKGERDGGEGRIARGS